jgi:hypothetical protein
MNITFRIEGRRASLGLPAVFITHRVCDVSDLGSSQSPDSMQLGLRGAH